MKKIKTKIQAISLTVRKSEIIAKRKRRGRKGLQKLD